MGSNLEMKSGSDQNDVHSSSVPVLRVATGSRLVEAPESALVVDRRLTFLLRLGLLRSTLGNEAPAGLAAAL